MGYDIAKIRKKIAENKRSAVLSRAKLHQMRIKFHTVKRVTSFNSPYISIPLTQFLAFVGDRVLVAHNADFDMSFINSATSRCQINYNPTYIDTLDLNHR